MANEIKLNDAKCKQIMLAAPVMLIGEDLKSNRTKNADFEIEAYTGAVVDRWWGKLAIDVDGISSKKAMPIFRNHRQEMIVGYSSDAWKDKSFFVAGKFVESTEYSKEVKALAQEGFPWQASIGVKPKKILSVENGQKHKVNGKDLHGPAEVWLESEVLEVSFVPLGADSNTGVSIFSVEETEQPEAGSPAQRKEQETMAGENQKPAITMESLKSDHPDIYNQVFEAGKKAGAADELARIKGVSEQLMPGHEKLIGELMFDGQTTGPQAAVKVLAAHRQQLENVQTDLQTDSPKPVTQALAPETEKPKSSKTPKEQWDADANLREEFGDDFDAFEAYCEATGKGMVKSISKK